MVSITGQYCRSTTAIPTMTMTSTQVPNTSFSNIVIPYGVPDTNLQNIKQQFQSMIFISICVNVEFQN